MSKGTFPAWLKWMIISAVLVSVLAVSVLVYLTADAVRRELFDIPFNLPGDRQTTESDEDQAALLPPIIVKYDEVPITPAVETEAQAAQIPTVEPLPPLLNRDRQTFLVMGNDTRPGETYPARTDTMILLSLDPETNEASILSVPRDLYVEIPGYARERINVAYVLGELYEEGDSGGAQLAMDTIQHNFGIEVDHFVMVDFNSVTNIIDAFGGVPVNVPKEIYDPLYPDMNYGYDPFYIEAGEHVLDGETALKYMRTRHADNDIERAKRQQATIMGFRQQLLDLGLLGIAQRAPAVWSEVQDGVFTDLTFNELLSFVNAASGVSAENIQSGVLDFNYVYSHTTTDGASVLLMYPEPVAGLVRELFD